VTASPLIPTTRFATADATVADLRREMREMREMLQSVRPGMAASTDVAPDPSVQSLVSADELTAPQFNPTARVATAAATVTPRYE